MCSDFCLQNFLFFKHMHMEYKKKKLELPWEAATTEGVFLLLGSNRTVFHTPPLSWFLLPLLSSVLQTFIFGGIPNNVIYCCRFTRTPR